MPDAPEKKLCFVVGPIGDEGTDIRNHADWLLKGIICPVLAGFPSFLVKRADHDTRPGLIDIQMINDLLNAELVIADLSFLNANAFYEIGIRHMAQKPIIHMQLATELTPFDISLYRAIKFSRASFDDVERAKEALKSFVDAVLASNYQPENPVTNAIGRLKLEQNATPEMRVMMEEIDALKSRFNSILNLLPPPVAVASAPDAAAFDAAEFVKKTRKAAHLSQAELARRLGVSTARISELEAGRGGPYGPSVVLLARLAEACGGTLQVSVGASSDDQVPANVRPQTVSEDI
jgi:DNA-binding XRE family transcriptional regulator